MAQSTISLVGFRGIGIPSDIVRPVEQRVESALFTHCHCAVISKEELDGTIAEFLNTDVGRAAMLAREGAANGRATVDTIVTGTLSRVGPSYSIILKLVDVKSGCIVASAHREHTGSLEALLDCADATVAALFEQQNQETAIDTQLVPSAAKQDGTNTQPLEKEVPRKKERQKVTAPVADEMADRMIEKIGIGAIAIFASIAAILLMNTTR
ncbi:MAG: hypothetical protein JW768_13465 [Chitinispirillaceae bacterium]|nr:hypothetical protein [Chitinispirillaceae bacterium]